MDKSLSDIQKDNDDKRDELKSPLSAAPAATPEDKTTAGGHQEYVPESLKDFASSPQIEVSADKDKQKTDPANYNPELSYKNWNDSKKSQRWDSTALGRGLIRLESRGVLGAAAFAAGGWYVTRGGAMTNYAENMKFSEIDPTKPLQYIAKSMDMFIGKPIKFTAKMLGASEQTASDIVHFRPTRYTVGDVRGRSLGREGVSITFDFFSASVADAIGRDLADLADPHVKHSWKDDKGNINYADATKALGKNMWRYVSYNGGEDWAAAVPYAFYMKGQRKLINKLSPGFNLDFDRAINGGSFKVNPEGKPTGNYLAAGMLDLQGRFTAYNDLTLMYREAYTYVDDKLHGKNVRLYGSPGDEDAKHKGIMHNVGDVLKWGARSTVKSVIYMTPSVPFFSVFRATQSKNKGLFINQETESALSYKKPGSSEQKYEILHADELQYGSKLRHDTIPAVKFRKMDMEGHFEKMGGKITNHPLSNPNFDPYKLGEGSSVLNAIGKGQASVRDVTNKLPAALGFSRPAQRSMDSYLNAAFAYTPYMYAKAETARLWDDGKMDASSERMINGAADLNWKEFKSGAGEVWRSILHKPLTDPGREAYAQKRIDEDSSPADNVTEEQAKLDAVVDHSRSPLYWRDRIVHAAPAEPKAKPEKPQSSHAEQEAMRKALNDLQPPTNSIH